MLQVKELRKAKRKKVCKLKEIGRRKGNLLQVEKYKANKAQRECK